MKKVVLLALLPLMSGCVASLFHDKKEQVVVKSDVEGTELYANEIYLGKDQATLSFVKGSEYILVGKKEGCEDATIEVSSSFDPTWLVNLVTFELVGGNDYKDFDQNAFFLNPVCEQDAQ